MMNYEMTEWSDLKRSQKDQTSVFAFCTLCMGSSQKRIDSYGEMVKIIQQQFEDPGKMMENYFNFESMIKHVLFYVFLKDQKVIAYCFQKNDGEWISNVETLNMRDQAEFRRRIGAHVWKQLKH
ncbi:hypothetical protein C815_00260 [Firmicutes bacterium M10-2]|nr:hypothetical protein C815_00260 [Firmicutes bacterium M10-2]